ncbi:hypothetical protein CDL12_01383 [Handroanthus impetiginosus]|uniref:Bifunctional inhibitor/plant lipid transfer protein/seed storage helical domain-containing protein n=1 Tax=Handroanthus impetiginosus TaxID=429701 RepID=A0A2G9I7Z6_9LAMI|nr:hypothetical protein CDL12_01383 [Handroanthus impetiginosus]
MDNAITLQLLMALMLLVLYPKVESQWLPRQPLPPVNHPPLCASQFALVNRACALLPYSPVPPPSPDAGPPSPSSLDVLESSRHDRRGHGHGHGHGHGQEHEHRHDHGHSHSHRHSRHHHKETSVEADCCRWLKEVDNVCVCDLLVHLPPFLTRPVHNYTVIVDDSCNVTFQCGSRLVKL